MTSPRSLVRIAALAIPLGTWAFVARGGVGIGASILASILLVSLPALAVAQLGEVVPEELDTMPIYLTSALLTAFLGTLSLVVGLGELDGETLGLGPIDPGSLLLWSGVATSTGIAALVGGSLVSRARGWRETELVELLMPTDGTERAGFVLVSVTAGIGEELAYRAFLLGVVTSAFGAPWTAVAVSSIAFGLLHAYQGPLGMLRTGFIGFAFAVVVLIAGSVWPVVLGHIIINLIAGLVLGDWLLDRDN